AAYGVVSYWTAYFKANHPTEYMAALLTSTQENRDRLGLYLGDCRHRGITVLPPDVNESDLSFSAVGDDIRFGLSAIRNVASPGGRPPSPCPTSPPPPSATTSASGSPRSATSAPTWSRRSSPRARRRAPSPRSRTSWTRCR